MQVKLQIASCNNFNAGKIATCNNFGAG